MFAVSCNSIKKTYSGNVLALNGANLDIYEKELLILAGPSGCGKTTLISIISGVLSYDSGQCFVFGRELSSLKEKELSEFRSKIVGFVFQSLNLIPTLNVCENISVPLLIQNFKRAETEEKTKQILDQLEILDKLYEYTQNLSGGQRQRVAIARGLIHDPKLLVCDEPTSALDAKSGKNVMKILRDLVDNKGKTIIVVTHDERTFDFANRIVFMDDGKITNIHK